MAQIQELFWLDNFVKTKTLKWILACCLIAACDTNKKPASISDIAKEKYRPLIHFTPKEHWMNDPNGMVYYNNTWHLFYQYYPGATVWGPMHWGHATSTDLVHWQHQPIALYPDSLGYIFSGSAVVDSNNTSEFGTKDKPALVAVYTSHDTVGEKAGTKTFQTQSIAYSIDNGNT
jgi:fructan beta-fructosidase